MAALWGAMTAGGAATTTASAPVDAAKTVTVRLATYNVRNYGTTSRPVDGQYLKDWPKPEAEKAALRAVILKARPDVLAMEEMGDARELGELQRDLGIEGLDYPYSVVVNGPDPDRHVAVLSRLPFAKTHTYENVTYRLGSTNELAKRGLLEVDFVTAGQSWALYVMHLKSRLPEDDDGTPDPVSANHREGEAMAMRDLIRAQPPPGARLAVVGDFNDTRDSVTLKRFLELDGKPLFQMAPAADSRGQTWTFIYPKADTYERIDFVLLSAALEPSLKGPGRVVDIPESDEASDHRMVWVELTFPAAGPPGNATTP
jgi:endonuclease/exonuclease/phosphatase family metal-dependent hydrolase